MLRHNSPSILAGFAVGGTVVTAYLTAKGSFQAKEIIDRKLTEEATFKDKAELTWPCYIPAAGAGVITIGCIVSSTTLHGRRAAAAVSAYSITEKAFTEYREKVKEEIGAHKEQVIRDDIARAQVDANPSSDRTIIAGSGNVLCCELYTMRYFTSDMEALRKAQNDINSEVMSNLYTSLDEFYDMLGLPHTAHSSDVGWDSDKLMELEFTTVLSDDGKPCLAFNYNYTKPI